MDGDLPDALGRFETWLFCCGAEAVEAREVPAALLTELCSAFDAARAVPAEEEHAKAMDSPAEVLEIPLEEAAQILTAPSGPPRIVRDWQVRRTGEAWLEGQRKV